MTTRPLTPHDLSGPVIFFLFGYARSGKDTFAQALAEASPRSFGGVEIHHFASALKESLAAALHKTGFPESLAQKCLNGSGPEKEAFRPAMVAYGTAVRKIAGDGVFADGMVDSIRSAMYEGLKPTYLPGPEKKQVPHHTNYAVADGRFLVEYLALEQAFPGRVIPVYLERAGKEPADETEATSVGELRRYLLDNNPPFHIHAKGGRVDVVRRKAAELVWTLSEVRKEKEAFNKTTAMLHELAAIASRTPQP